MQSDDKHKSTLREIKGILKPPTINPNIVGFKTKNDSVKEIVAQLLKGNITNLSRAITLIESTSAKHQEKANQIIDACLPFANNSIRIGITGVPGVGKSTFIESFGNLLTLKGKKVAVLAIDPSSSLHKGSILGDKTRMQELVKNKNVFIRPSPSGKNLGGVAKKTRESIILCEAAGFDIILIETVGVGQSETVVHNMIDFFLLLKLAGAGDELQGIKRGIIEMADTIVINKADNDNEKQAKLAKREFLNALHLYPLKESLWQPKVTTCSALNNRGIDTIWEIILEYITLTKSNNYFEENRINQNKFWLIDTVNQALQFNFYSSSKIKKRLEEEIELITNHKSNPFKSARKLLQYYFNNIQKK